MKKQQRNVKLSTLHLSKALKKHTNNQSNNKDVMLECKEHLKRFISDVTRLYYMMMLISFNYIYEKSRHFPLNCIRNV